MSVKLLLIATSLVVATSIVHAQETVTVPKVALAWSFAENEGGTSEAGIRSSNDLLHKLWEERQGCEIVSDAVVRAAWKGSELPLFPSTVEDAADLPSFPDPKGLLAFGKKAGVDFVCIGTLKWHVKSVWVGLGPKTKADATVNVMIIDVKKGEIVLDAKNVNSNDTKTEKWYETAGALLLTWGITVFSGGPKTPRVQESAVKAIGAATDPFFQTSASGPKKIG